MRADYNQSIEDLSGVGKAVATRLKKLGVATIFDLITYFPFRYDDLSQITTIAQVKSGDIVTVKAKVQMIKNFRSPRKRMMITESLVKDQTASLKVVWFNQGFLTKVLEAGDSVYLSGKCELSQYGLQLVSPIFEKVRPDQIHTAGIIPIYSTTSNLTQKQLRFLIKKALPVTNSIIDWLPQPIQNKYRLTNLKTAYQQIHFPQNQKNLESARHRLKFDELFLIQLFALKNKQDLAKQKSPLVKFKEKETKAFVSKLPFKLTDAQRKAAWEILKDLAGGRPMNRLLEGDVGSGKTITAVIAVINCFLNGFQSVLMAPTEILARQHYDNIKKLLQKKLKVAILTRAHFETNLRSSVTKKELIGLISDGAINFVIGTHALIEGEINFHNLGLAIVDEQHRFGVAQRKKLKSQSKDELLPHLLSMTATPIPRSLALAIYGDLDLSIIDQLPSGRKKIITKIVQPEKRDETYKFIDDQIKAGRQIFVVCPLIDPSDKLGVKAVTTEYKKLDQQIFPELIIGLLHGKLKPKDKDKVMQDFSDNKINILVSTSVVEVGIDIPNATVMMIEGAERFGLAQLHQFRGRIGRDRHQSYCFLFTENETAKTLDRLEALVASQNGFELAEKDLQFRGPGEIYGIRQSGYLDLKIATLSDHQIIQEAREAAQKSIKQLDKFSLLSKKIAQFGQDIHLE
ncbi:MAG: ATP-dependent DNA helicase RecG [Patescibacteria group bacterium]